MLYKAPEAPDESGHEPMCVEGENSAVLAPQARITIEQSCSNDRTGKQVAKAITATSAMMELKHCAKQQLPLLLLDKGTSE